MSLSAAQRKANEKYIQANYRQVKLSMPIAEAKNLEAHCVTFGYTKAGFIRQAIKDKIKQDRENKGRMESKGLKQTGDIMKCVPDEPETNT